MSRATLPRSKGGICLHNSRTTGGGRCKRRTREHESISGRIGDCRAWRHSAVRYCRCATSGAGWQLHWAVYRKSAIYCFEAVTSTSLLISTLSGESEPCEIQVTDKVPISLTASSAHFGLVTIAGDNLFDVLTRFRLLIERDGYLLLCNAARRDTYPSRMALEMGGGRKVYMLRPGKQAKREDLIDALGAAAIDQVCTVAEQRTSYASWTRSLK